MDQEKISFACPTCHNPATLLSVLTSVHRAEASVTLVYTCKNCIPAGNKITKKHNTTSALAWKVVEFILNELKELP